MESQQIIAEIARVVGTENTYPGDERVARSLVPASWNRWPLCIVRPGSAAEVTAVVQATEAGGAAILPCGSGSRLYTGGVPADKPYILLQTVRMNRILDYQPDDLTVTCQPGVTLEALQQTLAARRQFLALDCALPERITIGGIVASGASGFSRPSFGAARDLVIGLKAVVTDGVEVKGGGKVVKNVAGYDVCKLFTGSWGTLGTLTEVTFKVRPMNEAELVVSWETPDVSTAAAVGLKLYHSEIAPAYVLATNEPEGRPTVVAGLQGISARVLWQQEQLGALVRDFGVTGKPIALGEVETSYLRDVQARLHRDVHLSARISCLPTELPGVIRSLELLQGLQMTAQCAVGTLNVAALSSNAALTLSLRSATPKGANLLWTRLDPEIAKPGRVALWGEPRQDFSLQRLLKQAIDPKNTFSPGRFVGGL